MKIKLEIGKLYKINPSYILGFYNGKHSDGTGCSNSNKTVLMYLGEDEPEEEMLFLGPDGLVWRRNKIRVEDLTKIFVQAESPVKVNKNYV